MHLIGWRLLALLYDLFPAAGLWFVVAGVFVAIRANFDPSIGPARLLFAPDLIGTSEEIAERLHAHAAFREVDEVAFALPFTFGHDDYVQILTDIATRLGPALGRPAP